MENLYAESFRRGLPFHCHVEEQPKEVEDCMAVHGATPLGLINSRLPAAVEEAARREGREEDETQPLKLFTAVHCNHSSSDDLRQFTNLGGTVVSTR